MSCSRTLQHRSLRPRHGNQVCPSAGIELHGLAGLALSRRRGLAAICHPKCSFAPLNANFTLVAVGELKGMGKLARKSVKCK